MNKDFILYDEALALKELGFDEPCLGLFLNDRSFIIQQTNKYNQYYNQICMSPTYSQAFRWFREKYRLDGHVTFPESKTNKIEGINSVYYDIEIYTLMSGDAYKTYQFTRISDNKEKAELACLRALIELVKSKQ